MALAFCAWDGGELARTSDYREVWGVQSTAVGAATVFHPWNQLLSIGQFNWRNGHGDACPIPGWPGCQNPQPTFYRIPATGSTAADDDAPVVVVADVAAGHVTLVQVHPVEEDAGPAVLVDVAVGDDDVAVATGQVDAVEAPADQDAGDGQHHRPGRLDADGARD